MAGVGADVHWDGVEALVVVLDDDPNRVLEGNYEPCSHATGRVETDRAS